MSDSELVAPTAPDRIWLQPTTVPYDRGGEWTWSWHEVGEGDIPDIEYVRADRGRNAARFPREGIDHDEAAKQARTIIYLDWDGYENEIHVARAYLDLVAHCCYSVEAAALTPEPDRKEMSDRCGFVPQDSVGYGPCLRVKGHEGSCAHPATRTPADFWPPADSEPVGAPRDGRIANVILYEGDCPKLKGKWVAVPYEDFAALRSASPQPALTAEDVKLVRKLSSMLTLGSYELRTELHDLASRIHSVTAKPVNAIGSAGNWVAPFHECPYCKYVKRSLDWSETTDGITAKCVCGVRFEYRFDGSLRALAATLAPKEDDQ